MLFRLCRKVMRIEAGKAFIFKNRLHMQRMHLISFSIEISEGERNEEKSIIRSNAFSYAAWRYTGGESTSGKN